MRNHNIFGVNDQSDLDSIPDLSSFRNIHLVLSHNKLADPEGKIPTFIVNNGFKLCDVIGHEPGTIIQIYRKANANCQSLILEESGTVYRGTCYAWEKSKLFDQVSGSRIDMYQGPTKIDGKCQELPNKLNSVFNINDGFAFGPTLEVKSTSCRKIEFKIVFSNPENAQAQMIITSYDEDEEMSYDVLNVANDKANSGLDSLIFKQGFWNPNNEARRYRAYVWNEGNKTFTLKKMQVSIWED